MKIVCVEEHMLTEDVLRAWHRADPHLSEPMMRWTAAGSATAPLLDVGGQRLAAMDAAGIDVAVLSLTTPGLQNLGAAEVVALQVPTNDEIAAAVADHPSRFQGFAALATADPHAAAGELERAVRKLGLHGAMLHAHTGDRHLDDPALREIFEVAAALRAPIYLHPRAPMPPVVDASYRGISPTVDNLLATGTFGWHYDAGVALLRLIVSGMFDRLPDLRIVVGHWGEVVLFYLDRIALLDGVAGLERPIAEYFTTNIWVTSGGIASQRYLDWAVDLIGADRIMHATDYPFNTVGEDGARTFLEESSLGPADREKVASANWERLLSGLRR